VASDVKVTKNLRNGKVVVPEEVEVLEAEQRPEERHSYVPHPDYGLKYVSRTVNGQKDFDVLQFCMDRRVNLLVRGPTGSGKTMFPMAWAALKGLNFYAVPCDVSMEPGALLGGWQPDGEGGFVWQDGPVTELVRSGGVLDISEANFMSPKVAASLFPLLDHRRELPLLRKGGEIVKAHEKLLVVTDYNPDYRGTMQLNEAFLNRFAIKIPWDYNEAVEGRLIKSSELLEMAKKIRASPGIKTPVSTNSLMEFIDIAVALGYNFAEANFNAMFSTGERGALKLIVDAHSDKLKPQIAGIAKKLLGAKLDTVLPDTEYDVDWNAKMGQGLKQTDFTFEDDDGDR
jgi:hypothetical protein